VFNWTIIDLLELTKQAIENLLENIGELIHAFIQDYIKNSRSSLDT
jgi:hypothetical protein